MRRCADVLRENLASLPELDFPLVLGSVGAAGFAEKVDCQQVGGRCKESSGASGSARLTSLDPTASSLPGVGAQVVSLSSDVLFTSNPESPPVAVQYVVTLL